MPFAPGLNVFTGNESIADRGIDAGDLTFVTARTPDRVLDTPDYLAAHGVPSGPIETGTSGMPWVWSRLRVATRRSATSA